MDSETQDLITIKRQELIALLRKALEAIQVNLEQMEVKYEDLKEQSRELESQIDAIDY